MIGFADWNMRGELSRLWQICFNEPCRPANYFFNNAFDPANCLVYCVGGHVVSMLHMLPVRLVQNGGTSVQAHYIFACATLPQYRSHGFMNSLLAYAALIGTRRGDQYSVILPAEENLYGFYEKADYTKFFRVETREVSRVQMQEIAGSAKPAGAVLKPSQLNQIRMQSLSAHSGSAFWNDRSIWFAVGFNAVYGGRLVCTHTGGLGAYAVCRAVVGCTCEVTEWMVQPDAYSFLAAQLLHDIPAQSFQLRLPEGTVFPMGTAVVCPLGMIKSLGGAEIDRLDTKAPYLGFAMD